MSEPDKEQGQDDKPGQDEDTQREEDDNQSQSETHRRSETLTETRDSADDGPGFGVGSVFARPIRIDVIAV